MPKKNGFSNFMFAYKSLEKDKGRDIDLSTATLEAGKIWQVSKKIIFSYLT